MSGHGLEANPSNGNILRTVCPIDSQFASVTSLGSGASSHAMTFSYPINILFTSILFWWHPKGKESRSLLALVNQLIPSLIYGKLFHDVGATRLAFAEHLNTIQNTIPEHHQAPNHLSARAPPVFHNPTFIKYITLKIATAGVILDQNMGVCRARTLVGLLHTNFTPQLGCQPANCLLPELLSCQRTCRVLHSVPFSASVFTPTTKVRLPRVYSSRSQHNKLGSDINCSLCVTAVIYISGWTFLNCDRNHDSSNSFIIIIFPKWEHFRLPNNIIPIPMYGLDSE